MIPLLFHIMAIVQMTLGLLMLAWGIREQHPRRIITGALVAALSLTLWRSY